MELDIPIPEAGIALIDDKTECLSDPPIFSTDNYGYCFFSKRINKVTVINPTIIPHIINKEEFYKVILFDHLVYNKDRNKGNLLVTVGNTPKLYVIDHTHVFKNATIWDRYCFQQGIAANDFNDRDILEANMLLYSYFGECLIIDPQVLLQKSNDFKSKINQAILAQILSELPQDWEPPKEDINALTEYLLYRLEHLDDICNVIIRK